MAIENNQNDQVTETNVGASEDATRGNEARMGSMDMESGADNSNNVDGGIDREIEETEFEHHDIKLAIAGVAGNVLEWYDFAVFGYFSDIIGDVFFPQDGLGSHSSLVKSFAVFGAAFLARPIGGALIGWFGDSSSRQSALELSIVMMAFPTFALGCLPSYDDIGGLATFLLILFRFCQGLSVGGQLMSSVVFTLEKTHISGWGLWGSSVYAFSQIGVVIGSLLSYILRESLSDEQLRDWGWRIPFLLGLLGVLPAFYLKKYGKRSHQNRNSSSGRTKNALKLACGKENRRALLTVIMIVSQSAASYYLIAIWMPIFMETMRKPPVDHAFAISTIVGFIMVPLTFLGGWISDFFSTKGWKQLMVIMALSLGVLSPIFFKEISTVDVGESQQLVTLVSFWLTFALGCIMVLYNGSMTPYIVSRFPVEVRLTSLSIAYNVALCVFGGFSPSLATLLTDKYDEDATSAGLIITVLSAISITGVFLSPSHQYSHNETMSTNNNETETPDNDLVLAEDDDKDNLPQIS